MQINMRIAVAVDAATAAHEHGAVAAGGISDAFMPETDDEVVVAFEHGDLRSPSVVSSLWNSKGEPPPEKS